MKRTYFIFLLVLPVLISFSDPYGIDEIVTQKEKKAPKSDKIVSNPDGQGVSLEIEFTKGIAHNHPSFAFWVEDTSGNYIQSLFVSKSIGTGVFNFGEKKDGRWEQGEVRRPASLPYWAHKRGIKADDGLYIPSPEKPVPDAYTGATPKNNFVINTKLDKKGPEVFNVLFEINQPWDWNKYWTNNKYPGNIDYESSAQPALVYKGTIDLTVKENTFTMQPVGHSHYAGLDGSLTTDLSTMTTALEIAESIVILLK